ncbi:MAG: MotA/TolQ/ExbB proton channel family protein [Saprospiraceae bacterium]
MCYINNPLFLDVSFWQLMFGNNSASGIIIIIIIFILLATSVYLFWRHFIRFRGEEISLNLVRKNLAAWKHRQNQVQSHNHLEDEDLEAFHLAPIDELQEGVNPNAIIYDRLTTLRENQITRSRLNVGVLQNLAELKESKDWTANYLKYVMNLAVLLGLLGTFIGLTYMVGDISDQLEKGGDVNTIQNTLAQVKTAFSTTLAGLICTVIVSIFNFYLEQKKATFFDQLEQFTVQDLLPSTFPELEEKTMLETVGDQLEDTFNNLNQTIENNNASIGELNGLYSKFDRIEDTLRSILTAGETADMQGIVREISTVNASMKVMIDKYQNKQLLEDFRGLTEHHKKYVLSLNGILQESKWIPDTKVFLIAIATLLLIIASFLGIQVFG